MSSGAPPPLPVSKLPQETEALSYTRMEPVFYEVQVSNQARQRVRMIPIHNRPGINELFHIKGHFLSISITSPLESGRSYVNEERLVGNVFPNSGTARFPQSRMYHALLHASQRDLS
jgi:hypothetical protein